MSATSQDIYEEVQQRFLDALDRGTVPWQKPWVGSEFAPRNLQSGRPYRGINALLLALSGYGDPRWTTFAAAKKQGGKVRKGEKSTLVTLWKRIVVKDEEAKDGKRIVPILRYFRVFNVEQCDWPDGVVPELVTPELPERWEAVEEAEAAFTEYLESENAPSFHHNGGDRAYYSPLEHMFTVPKAVQFHNAPGYYGTLFHEAVHSTGHKSMLDRLDLTSFGSDSYAKEELVAEIGAAFICAMFGLDDEFDNSAAYIDGWRRRISDDPKLIVQAAGQAQKAADRILGVTFDDYSETNGELVAA